MPKKKTTRSKTTKSTAKRKTTRKASPKKTPANHISNETLMTLFVMCTIFFLIVAYAVIKGMIL